MKKIKDKIIAIVTSTLFKVSVLAIVFIVLITYAEEKQGERICKVVNINIHEEYDNYFIDQKEVMDLMTKNSREPVIGRSYEGIRLKELETRVRSNKLIEEAEVYRDIHGNLNVDVIQKRPIARFITKLNGSWYISDKGNVFPTSDKYTARVPIIDGDYAFKLINTKFDKDTNSAKLLEMLQMVDKDEFLKAIVSEIEIDIDSLNDVTPQVTIYPQLGSHIIQYGGFENPANKLQKIKVVYKDILPVKGWETYKRINIAYKNQIICE